MTVLMCIVFMALFTPVVAYVIFRVCHARRKIPPDVFDWQAAESVFAPIQEAGRCPSCVPTNVREWQELARQADLVRTGQGMELVDIRFGKSVFEMWEDIVRWGGIVQHSDLYAKFVALGYPTDNPGLVLITARVASAYPELYSNFDSRLFGMALKHCNSRTDAKSILGIVACAKAHSDEVDGYNFLSKAREMAVMAKNDFLHDPRYGDEAAEVIRIIGRAREGKNNHVYERDTVRYMRS